jgi:uncharacterized Zn finger protein
MAAVVNEAVVEQAASAEDFLGGQELRAAGAVSGTAAAYGGVGGFVLDDGRQYDVWVGIQGRALVGECDCPVAGTGALCAHGAALALDAVAAGLRWTPAPGGPADDELAGLTLADKGRLLDALLREKPELRPVVGQLAAKPVAASGADDGG